MKAAPMHYPVLDHRWPGLLLQIAFYQCCQATRGTNRIAWGTKLLLTLASLVDCISLCHILKAQRYSFIVSQTEGTALLFQAEWVL